MLDRPSSGLKRGSSVVVVEEGGPGQPGDRLLKPVVKQAKASEAHRSPHAAAAASSYATVAAAVPAPLSPHLLPTDKQKKVKTRLLFC